jgi:putative membrane protein
MNTLPTFRKTPLAAAIVIGGALLIGLGGCKKKSEEATENAPPASATAAAPAPATTAAGAMASDTTGMGTPASTPADMSGTPPAAEAGGMGAPAEVTTGPITDTQFYTQAMSGNQKEIATAQMVAGQATNADVKKLANKIMADHQAFEKKVEAAAGAGVTPPTGEVDSSVQGKTGKDLDKAYVDAMVSDHEKDIPMFENASKNASTPGARKLASEALPTLRSHLKSAQELQKKMAASS